MKSIVLGWFSVALAALSIQNTLFFSGGASPIPTVAFWAISAAMLMFLFFILRENRSYLDGKGVLFLQLYLAWLFVCVFRGLIAADNYWFYKSLVGNTMSLLMVLAIGVAARAQSLIACVRKYVFFALPAFVIVLFVSSTEGYGYYLSLIPIFILAIPYVRWRWGWLFLVLALLASFSDFDARSNVIKFIVPVLFLFLFWFGARKVALLEFSRKILYALPIVLFFLGVFSVFNVFKISEYVKGDYSQTTIYADGTIKDSNLAADTRTFLYDENLRSASEHGYWLWGRTPARGYDTVWFRDLALISGVEERPGSEVSILNIFTWLGIVGVMLYGAIFWRASWLAVNRSNNMYCRVVGMYVAFRWLYAWVEDFSSFNLNAFSLWLLVGICLSSQLRSFSDKDISTMFSFLLDGKAHRSGTSGFVR